MTTSSWKWWVALAAAFPAGLLAVWAMNALVAPSGGLGLENGRLRPCPDRPNCVGSQEEDPAWAVAPFHFPGSVDVARESLKSVIARMPRTRLVSESKDYVHIEFVTPLCRFVDDVEFLFLEGEQLVHIRSASRVGYSDLGTNRRRIEEIRSRLGW